MIITIMKTPGATPKETMSANESNCFPKSPLVFVKRDVKPSKKSAKTESNRKSAAKSNLPEKVKMTEIIPQHKFVAVNKFASPNMCIFGVNLEQI